MQRFWDSSNQISKFWTCRGSYLKLLKNENFKFIFALKNLILLKLNQNKCKLCAFLFALFPAAMILVIQFAILFMDLLFEFGNFRVLFSVVLNDKIKNTNNSQKCEMRS